MANPVEKGSLAYEAVTLIDYDLPPELMCEDPEVVGMVKRDAKFRKTLCRDADIASQFIAHQNHVFHCVKPPVKWEWSQRDMKSIDLKLSSDSSV